MDIGHRLRSVREEKKYRRGILNNEQDCFAAAFLAWRTVTPFRPSRRRKSLREAVPMPRKVKTNIFMSPRQMADLRQISAETDIPIAALIRRGVDWVIAQYLSEQLKVVGRADKYKVKARQPSKSIN